MSDLQLAQIDTDLLIQEVKIRPTLYAKDAPKYNDNNFKKKIWEEVVQILFANTWSSYTHKEKAEKVEVVQKRWKNLRACFSRELKRQKDPKWIYGVAYKRRKYLYFDELSFLNAELDKSNDGDEASPDIDLPEVEGDSTTVTLDTNIEVTPIPDVLLPAMKKDPKLIPNSEPHIAQNNDLDSTNFALSLVPMLNMLSMETRIDAKISILSVLKQFYKKENDTIGVKKSGSGSKRTYGKRKMFEVPVEIKSEAESDDDDES